MKVIWKTAAASLLFSSLLSAPVLPAAAAEEGAAPEITVVQAQTASDWTSSLSISVKGVLNERVANGYRIGAVFEVVNKEAQIVRMPDDYELRAKTADGWEYKLKGSSTNARSLEPRAKTDLVFETVVERDDPIPLSELNWVNVDWYTYPKTETTVLSLPLGNTIWSGSLNMTDGQLPVLEWGKPFKLAAESSSLVFTPVSVTLDRQQTAPTVVLKMKVHNDGSRTEALPLLALEAASEKETFTGKQIEQGTLTLEAGLDTYVHFAVPVKQDTTVQKLVLLSADSFALSATSTETIAVGQAILKLPEGDRPNAFGVPQSYNLGEVIVTDKVNQLIPADVQTSIVGLGSYDNDAAGYKTIVAKFQLTNTSTTPLATPEFAAELVGADGAAYTGNRQTGAVQQLLPGLSHIVQYSFLVPATESGENLLVRLYDGKTVAPYKSEIAAVHTAIQTPDSNGYLSFYPFEMKINSWHISYYTNFNSGAGSSIIYSYKLKVDADIRQKEQVVADSSFSKLVVEIVDKQGRAIGTETLSFTANTETQRKLASGETIISFLNLRTETDESPLTLRYYEAIETPAGVAKRLVAEFKK